MKKFLLILAISFSVIQSWSQKRVPTEVQDRPRAERTYQIPLIGDPAPSFTAESTNGTLKFPGDYGSQWKILFSHPADYTPVCTTEIMELADLQDEFDKLGVKIAVVSTDRVDSHLRWKKDMEGISFKDGKQINIKFPIVSDENLSISRKYGMIHPSLSTTKTVRGVFIINPENKVAAILFYPMNVGRSTDEILRMIVALQTTASANVCTPVNWKAGNDVLIPYNPTPSKDLDNPEIKPPEGYYNLAWFLWYKKSN